MENIFDEHREIGPRRHAQERHAESQNDQCLHRSLVAHELNALFQARQHRLRRLLREKTRRDHSQRNNGSKKRNRIQPEAPSLAKLRERLPGQRRSHHHRHVELDRVQRDGVRHIFFFDERRNQRLISRPAESLRKARNKRQAQNVPDVHAAR